MASIGIDLGTTNSCVGAVINGRVEIIANKEGPRTTPSCVIFLDDTTVVGNFAKRRMNRNLENTVLGVKRLIGRSYGYEGMEEDLKRFNFKVIKNQGRLAIQVKQNGVDTILYPEDISALVLAEMKSIAEGYTGKQVFNAVITVPAYFNVKQREATKAAAKKANLEVLAMINEPTAAALAFGTQRKSESKRRVLVYDLGGGTFDVTILTIQNEEFEANATGGETRLGGDDFDQKLFQYFAAKFKEKHEKDVELTKSIESKLRAECEKIKIELSSTTTEMCYIDHVLDGITFECPVHRSDFVSMNLEYFDKTFKIVEETLKDAKLQPNEISDVILVGGSTRIPYVREELARRFGKDKIKTEVHPDEAVAYGAAIKAAMLSGQAIENMENIRVRQITPLSLGVETEGGIMSVVVKRNTTIPTEKTGKYTTVADNQKTVNFQVYQGERANIKDNIKIGKFKLTGIEPMKARLPALIVTFKIDGSGILYTSAVDKKTGNSNSIAIRADERQVTEEDKEKNISEADKKRKADEHWKQRTEAANELKFFAEKLKSDSRFHEVHSKCDEVLDWIKKNEGASIEAVSKKQVELGAFNTSITAKKEQEKEEQRRILAVQEEQQRQRAAPADPEVHTKSKRRNCVIS